MELACCSSESCGLSFGANALVDFFSMYRNLGWCMYTDPYLIAFNAQNGHGNIVTDHQSLTHPASQNQHGSSLSFFRRMFELSPFDLIIFFLILASYWSQILLNAQVYQPRHISTMP